MIIDDNDGILDVDEDEDNDNDDDNNDILVGEEL